MRERAEELGGTLELLPRSGGGTVVRAILPRDPS
jgi:signal transduction histidine kinase